ncbi:transmembrane protein 132C-like [Entelurus aequoreus]|uniref:transmembrane protein 132C-like n=1 Tax=Entelurus aequoreus TaxID=161455 RepID=UPI002B1D2D43|nr:transmembrane protein 132C-like [Entelurus aequoreus]
MTWHTEQSRSLSNGEQPQLHQRIDPVPSSALFRGSDPAALPERQELTRGGRHGAAPVREARSTFVHSGRQQGDPRGPAEEANQDLMRNSSLQARTESFFIQQARHMPYVNASYGPLSVQQPVPLEMLQTQPGPFNQHIFISPAEPTSASLSPLFTFNWKIHTYIINERIHPSWPKVQVLFYVAGRDWDDYSAIQKLPCIRMFAFHETQEVRGTCRLKGELGICVAELEPLASWFSPPTVRPGRQRVSEQAEGTPVELYYTLQTTNSGDCSAEDSRKGSTMRTEQHGPMGYSAGHTAMQRIGSVRLFQPLLELKLDSNFLVMVPSKPIRQRETVSAFLALSTLSSVQIFTLRVKLKDGVAFLGARASNPVVWTVSQDVRSEGHRVVTLHCRRKESSFGQREEAMGYQRVLQVDLEVNGLMAPEGGREVTWQVEYPLTRTQTSEVQTLIRLAPQDLGGIVPLAMDTEILNTAVLTGRTVAVPVKVVTVGTDGTVSDVTESVECRSTDELVIKLPEFWETSATAWFAQAEAQFALRGITEDDTKFYYVVSSLGSATATKVVNALTHPPERNKNLTGLAIASPLN